MMRTGKDRTVGQRNCSVSCRNGHSNLNPPSNREVGEGRRGYGARILLRGCCAAAAERLGPGGPGRPRAAAGLDLQDWARVGHCQLPPTVHRGRCWSSSSAPAGGPRESDGGGDRFAGRRRTPPGLGVDGAPAGSTPRPGRGGLRRRSRSKPRPPCLAQRPAWPGLLCKLEGRPFRVSAEGLRREPATHRRRRPAADPGPLGPMREALVTSRPSQHRVEHRTPSTFINKAICI